MTAGGGDPVRQGSGTGGKTDMASHETDLDVQLMLRFKEGDEKSFRQLFSKYQTRIINFCFRFCNDQVLAEDLAQEVFLRVYQGARRYRPKARFSTWIYRIAVNTCLNETRRLKKNYKTESIDQPVRDGDKGRPPEYKDDTHISAEALMAAGQRDEKIKAAVAKLPDQQRAVIVLRIYDEFSYREIADQMAVTEGKVKTLIYRARQQMKQTLSQWL